MNGILKVPVPVAFAFVVALATCVVTRAHATQIHNDPLHAEMGVGASVGTVHNPVQNPTAELVPEQEKTYKSSFEQKLAMIKEQARREKAELEEVATADHNPHTATPPAPTPPVRSESESESESESSEGFVSTEQNSTAGTEYGSKPVVAESVCGKLGSCVQCSSTVGCGWCGSKENKGRGKGKCLAGANHKGAKCDAGDSGPKTWTYIPHDCPEVAEAKGVLNHVYGMDGVGDLLHHPAVAHYSETEMGDHPNCLHGPCDKEPHQVKRTEVQLHLGVEEENDVVQPVKITPPKKHDWVYIPNRDLLDDKDLKTFSSDDFGSPPDKGTIRSDNKIEIEKKSVEQV
jgi:hypothetical protein